MRYFSFVVNETLGLGVDFIYTFIYKQICNLLLRLHINANM